MMFERFTGSARATVVSAQNEARRLHSHHIGTEHILLGLLDQPDAIATRVLRAAGISHESALADLERRLRDRTDREADDAAALRSIGIDLDQVRATVEDTFGPGALSGRHTDGTGSRWPLGRRRHQRRRRDHASSGHIPFAPRSKKVLELSLREALNLKHNHIGTEHILLAIVREGRGLAARILVDSGIELGALRAQVLAELESAH